MAVVEELIRKLDNIMSELKEMTQALTKLEPVSHLSKSAIQFNGGILGAIREHKEGKRLSSLINQPIYKEKSFYNLAGVILNYADDMVKILGEIQNTITKDDSRYYDTVTISYAAIMEAYAAWYNYSPDMANEGITIEGQDNVALGPSVISLTKEEFAKLDLLESIKNDVVKKETNDGGGCFGVILLFIISSAASLFAILS